MARCSDPCLKCDQGVLCFRQLRLERLRQEQCDREAVIEAAKEEAHRETVDMSWEDRMSEKAREEELILSWWDNGGEAAHTAENLEQQAK